MHEQINGETYKNITNNFCSVDLLLLVLFNLMFNFKLFNLLKCPLSLPNTSFPYKSL